MNKKYLLKQILPLIIAGVIARMSFCGEEQFYPHEIIRAARGGRLEDVQHLVPLVPQLARDSLNGEDGALAAAFHAAVSIADVNTIDFLMLNGAHVNTVYHGGMTPLHSAVLAGQLEIVRILLRKYKAEVNSQDYENRTPLFLAAQTGRPDIVRCLLKHGADVKKREYAGDTIIGFMASNAPSTERLTKEYEDILYLLIEQGLDVNSGNCNKKTPLHHAAEVGSCAMILFLLSNGARVDVENYMSDTPLETAIASGHLGAVRCFIESGVSVDTVSTRHGRTLLRHALQHGQSEIAQYLVAQGADMHILCSLSKTVLSYAIAARCNKVKIVQWVLRFGVPIDKDDEDTMQLGLGQQGGFDVRKLIRDRRREIENVLLGEPPRLPEIVQSWLRCLLVSNRLPRFMALPIAWSLTRGAKLPGMSDLPDAVVRAIVDMVVTPNLPNA